MHHYQSILVAVDFSDHSSQALARAIQLAGFYNATLDVIHVVDVPTYPVLEDVAVTGLPGVWDPELTETIMQNAHQNLNKLLSQHGLSEHRAHLVNGIPEDEILRFSDQHAIELIVMGRHGLRGWQRLLGSTTDSVLHNAACDVLTVKIDKKQNR